MFVILLASLFLVGFAFRIRTISWSSGFWQFLFMFTLIFQQIEHGCLPGYRFPPDTGAEFREFTLSRLPVLNPWNKATNVESAHSCFPRRTALSNRKSIASDYCIFKVVCLVIYRIRVIRDSLIVSFLTANKLRNAPADDPHAGQCRLLRMRAIQPREQASHGLITFFYSLIIYLFSSIQ